ncbi:peptidase M48 [Saccharomonospora sp. CUA-673]|uniref:M48 family metallopeptidase n=1 Tax=Saccharomonospora sp. CUA-673 TaxID=1904969 RepID=UPI0009633BBC|nr:M48 family metallopeptidase [Saccharomonospora sp. CUA-673]OLT46696.1 peptidase M48 [Saccharomonospora sp. CUA-673]
MNFFERQDDVRKASARLIVLFIVAVIAVIAVVNVAVVFFTGLHQQPAETLIGALLMSSTVMLLIIGGTSIVRTLMLRRHGGGKVARSMGAVPVPQDTGDPDLRRLRNVVEEIAISSGTPVPELYVMPHEQGINAFAAGWSPANAAVAVTKGALDRLNRDELQGVIAHEFSHVVNGDMRLNMKLIGVLAGLVGLAVVGRVMLGSGGRSGGSSNRGGGGGAAPLVMIGLVAMVVGFIGVFAGRVIKAAVSRQREYLADASAVQFTRQTEGLAGALKKIGGLPTGSQLRAGKTDDVSHMLFGEGGKRRSMLATHPPLPERIRALDPSFDPNELRALSQKWSQQPPSGLHEDAALGLAPAGSPPPPPQEQPGAAGNVAAAHVSAVAGTVGMIGGSDGQGGQRSAQDQGASVLARIPQAFLDRAHSPEAAVPLMFGLLLSNHPEVRGNQYQLIASRWGAPLAGAAWTDAGALSQLDPSLRLPLAEVAFPALRQRPPQAIDALRDTVGALAAADGRTSVFEYCFAALLGRELHEAVHQQPPWKRRRSTLSSAQQSVATVLAVLAAAGGSGPAASERAFQAGLQRVLPGVSLPFAPPPQGPQVLDQAWPVLDGLSGRDTQTLVEALVTVVADDGALTVAESELLRTVCAMLHCPMPPLPANLSVGQGN